MLDEEVADAPAGRVGVVELGSGWGGLARRLARMYPDVTFTGVERSIVPWAWSRIVCVFGGPSNIGFARRDLHQLFERPFERGIYLAYLAPRHMQAIEASLRGVPRERTTELVLISAAFALPRSTPERVVRVQDLYRTPVYKYRL